MSISTQPASVYTDLKGLDQLKHNLKGDSIDDLKVVAKQFEALFIQQMLKTMREAKLAEGMFDSNEGDLYVDLLDKQLSLNMSEGKGIGLADIIVQQLSQQLNVHPEADQATQDANAQLPGTSTDSKNLPAPPVSEVDLDNSDPQDFVKSLWPLAASTAKELGISPRVLIAQAALETGWGNFIAKQANGKSSHNLFNIKAGAGWQGDTVTVATTELKNGAAVKEYAAFRVYDSYHASFKDYITLIKHSPRYRQALLQARDPQAYAAALQQAGYATDPEYADKVIHIANGQTMADAIAGLKI